MHKPRATNFFFFSLLPNTSILGFLVGSLFLVRYLASRILIWFCDFLGNFFMHVRKYSCRVYAVLIWWYGDMVNTATHGGSTFTEKKRNRTS